MRFWDSSALVALHVEQAHTRVLREAHREDPGVLAWLLSDVEIRSALCRLLREGKLGPEGFREASERVEGFWRTVHSVALVEASKRRAKQLLGSHPLSAADALQLGAALVVCRGEPFGWEFVTLDDRLGEAARNEGFTVRPAPSARASAPPRR